MQRCKKHKTNELSTWKSMVSLASGAVQVLLRAPATPPARSCEIVPIWDCFCCANFLTLPSIAPWLELIALWPTLASVCISKKWTLFFSPLISPNPLSTFGKSKWSCPTVPKRRNRHRVANFDIKNREKT